jgi:ABC-type glycerol-3-phosphate transport system substrate-binding protein
MIKRNVFKISRFVLLIDLLLLSVTYTSVYATTNAEISISIPEYIDPKVVDKLVEDFEAQYPQINVSVLQQSSPISTSPQLDSAAYFSDMEKYVSTGDVLYINSYNFFPEGTLANYFLDLSPLAQADELLASDDFYPVAWRSFQWDQGIWAIPTHVELFVMGYSAEQFDELELPYPQPDWTNSEFFNTISNLKLHYDNGETTMLPLGLTQKQEQWLLRSLLSEGLFDEYSVPSLPKLMDNAPLSNMLTEWINLKKTGLVYTENPNLENSVFTIENLNSLFDSTDRRKGLLLPGEMAGAEVHGFAISSGTQYPDESYELVSYLSSSIEFVDAINGFPARQSLLESYDALASLNLSDELYALRQQALNNAIPVSEMRYFNYISMALAQATNGIEVEAALQNAQESAMQVQGVAITQREEVDISVTLPRQDDTSQETLRFGIHTPEMVLINKNRWEEVASEFTNDDTEISNIKLIPFSSFVDFSTEFDCFYSEYNLNVLTPGTLLDLSPLMDADQNFKQDDFLPSTLESVSFNGRVLGYPLLVQPYLFFIDSGAFAQVGITPPNIEWSTEEFASAVSLIKESRNEQPVIVGDSLVPSHLLPLIAAFGGLPIDFHTDPPIVDFISDTNVNAIRNIVDLINNGSLFYTQLPQTDVIPPVFPQAPISVQLLKPYSFANNAKQFIPVLFPNGGEYTSMSYNVPAAYITNTTQYPEACYIWISKISSTIDLMNGSMPARHSAIHDPLLLAAQGASMVELYTKIDEILSSDNLIIFSTSTYTLTSQESIFIEFALYEAIQAHVLENKDLEQALQEAQQKATTFLACTANLAPRDDTQDFFSYYWPLDDCYYNIEPTQE